MKKILIFLILISCKMLQAQDRYVFFLHNKFLEDHSVEEMHPEYGKCEYPQILEAFKKAGFTVISEIRPGNTDARKYAIGISMQIDSLVAIGVKPSHITVIGTSKGGYIAKAISASQLNSSINYVFIGCCSAEDKGNVYGNILSIYEESDDIGRSCTGIKKDPKSEVPHFKEITLKTGLKHGFLFKASPLWLNPAINWAKGNYN